MDFEALLEGLVLVVGFGGGERCWAMWGWGIS